MIRVDKGLLRRVTWFQRHSTSTTPSPQLNPILSNQSIIKDFEMSQIDKKFAGMQLKNVKVFVFVSIKEIIWLLIQSELWEWEAFIQFSFSAMKFYSSLKKKRLKTTCTMQEKGTFLSISMIFMRVPLNDYENCVNVQAASFDLTIMSGTAKLYKNGFLCWFYVQSCC